MALVAAISIGVSAGPVVAGAFGALVGPARWVGAELNEFAGYDPKHAVSLVAISLFYAACGAVFGWLAMLLRRTELEIADRRARDEVARVLHDTVLQTLALVERRVATTDPELAGAARDADRELRAFLFGADAGPAADLRSRLHGAVEHARRRAPATASRITVNVIEDGCRGRRSRPGPARPRRRRGGRQRPRARRAPSTSSSSPRPTTPARCSSPCATTGAGSIRPLITGGHGLSRVDHRPDGLDAVAGPRCAARPDGGTEVRLWSAAP